VRSVGECYTKCARRGYKYFGVQAGRECFCENSRSHALKYGRARNCRSYKGGGWANDVFQITSKRKRRSRRRKKRRQRRRTTILLRRGPSWHWAHNAKYIGRINMAKKMNIQFDFKMYRWGYHGRWTSLLHCGNSNTIRMPGIWLWYRDRKNFPHRYGLHVVWSTKRHSNWGGHRHQMHRLKPPNWRLHKVYHFEMDVSDHYVTVKIDGRVIQRHRKPAHHLLKNQRCWAGDPWHSTAAGVVLMRNILITTTDRGAKNQRARRRKRRRKRRRRRRRPVRSSGRIRDYGWSPRHKLGMCHGDCDSNRNCRGGLVCIHNRKPRGCSGRAKRGMDYCGRRGS